MKDLKFTHAFFTVTAWVFDIGAFAIWRPSARRCFQPIGDKELRVLLLALRDNHSLRFGGVDPAKVAMNGSDFVVNPDEWPLELTYSVTDCTTSLRNLFDLRILKRSTAIYSREHGQLIDEFRNVPRDDSEVMRTVVRFA